MLALKIGLDLWMVRPHVAATAILRLPGLRNGEAVPGMTSRAGTFGAVGIHPADTGIRPGRRMELPLFHHLDDTAMTPGTSGGDDLRPFDDVPEKVVERTGKLSRLRMMGFAELLGFSVVAPHAILRRHQRGDEKAFMVVGVYIAFLCAMAFHAANAFRRMAADLPIVDPADRHVLGLVAIDAALILRRHKRAHPSLTPLLDLDIAHAGQRQKQDEAQPADHVAGEIQFAVGRIGLVHCSSLRDAVVLGFLHIPCNYICWSRYIRNTMAATASVPTTALTMLIGTPRRDNSRSTNG